jgi:translation initiation factor 3 subunit C
LCQFIFKHGDDRSRTRALLCSVYHHALHDRYYRARDMLLMSHIQDVIDKVDTKTMILYNRALVTMGLSAFRRGLVQKAHDCLSGICSGRVRELLAQGQARWPEKDPEQEKVERRRQMPYHMHINPDLLDCVHLTSAMLLELPSLARGNLGSNQYVISKQFRKYLTSYNRQKFTGPPENTREHIMAATKSLLAGDWQKACDYVLNLDVWNLIPGEGGIKVKDTLRIRIKEEALRTYLITYGAHYDSMSLSHLCQVYI